MASVASSSGEAFHRANDCLRRRHYQQWLRSQRKVQILRSQVGFSDVTHSRPVACRGCANYHGLSYGTQRHSRTPLICAIHPHGWQEIRPCPDWRGVPGVKF